MRPAPIERSVQIGRRGRIDACDIAAPLVRLERQKPVTDMQMRVAVVEAAPALHREIEIAVPVAAWIDLPAGAGDAQREPARHGNGQAGAIAGNLGVEAGFPGVAVMIAAVGQKRDRKRRVGSYRAF